MKITIADAGADSCTLTETSPSTSNQFTVPLAKDTLLAALRALLSDPEKREVGAGPVLIERLRDGPRIHSGNGSFLIPYAHVLPIVLEA